MKLLLDQSLTHKLPDTLLKNPSVNPSDYPCGNPYRNPSGNPSVNPSVNPSDYPSERVPVTHRVTHQNGDSNPSDDPSGNPSPITSNWYIVTNNEVTNNSSKSGSNEEPEASSSDDEHGGSKTELEPEPEPEPTNRYPDAFEEWWNLYPRKQGKRKALNEWRRATKRISREELNSKTQHFADFHQHQGTDKQYIPLPTTWLARDGWDDELIPRAQTNSAPESKSKSQRYIELGERMARELEAQEAQKPQPTGTKQLEPPF